MRVAERPVLQEGSQLGVTGILLRAPRAHCKVPGDRLILCALGTDINQILQ